MIGNSRFALVFALMAAAWLYLYSHADIEIPVKRPFSEFPVHNRGWRMLSQFSFERDTLDILRPSDYILRSYMHPEGGSVHLYIGYHDSGGVHSPKHCLPGGGWHKAMENEDSLRVNGKVINFINAVYRKDDMQEMLFYWYQVRGESLTGEYSLKLHEIVSSALYRRRDVAFIRISVSLSSSEGDAYSTGTRFVRDFYPLISEFLPK